jgi:hypothetical protein
VGNSSWGAFLSPAVVVQTTQSKQRQQVPRFEQLKPG